MKPRDRVEGKRVKARQAMRKYGKQRRGWIGRYDPWVNSGGVFGFME